MTPPKNQSTLPPPGDPADPPVSPPVDPPVNSPVDPPADLPPVPPVPPVPFTPAPVLGSMTPTPASTNPRPEHSEEPFPDVDPSMPQSLPTLVDPLEWDTPEAMVHEIENHLRQSHGLEPDKALLRKIVKFIRRVQHVE